MISWILAAILSLSGNIGQAPYDLTVRVRPPHGVICIQVWDQEVVGGENWPVRQSCWVQDRLDPPVDHRRYTLGTGTYRAVVSINGQVIESQQVIVTEENPSNQTTIRR